MTVSANQDLTVPKEHLASLSDHCGEYPTLRKIPTPDPKTLAPGTALVRLVASGVCHSDLMMSLGAPGIKVVEPVIAGHEGVGYIVALGPHVRTGAPPTIGARVGVKFIADSCNCCDACFSGDDEYCSAPSISGVTRDGTFQQFIVAATQHLVAIPDAVSDEQAAPILCAGITTYKAVLSANVRPGEWIVVPGAGGGLGHLAVQYALALNARVLAVDSGPEKKALMESYGVHGWIDYATEADVPEAIKRMTNNQVRAAVITAGTTAPYQQAVSYLGWRGTIVCVGLPKEDAFPVTVSQMVFQQQSVVGSMVSNRLEAKEALELVALGKVKVQVQMRKFSEISDIYKELQAAKIAGRVVVSLDE